MGYLLSCLIFITDEIMSEVTSIEPRRITGFNKVGLYTLIKREVGRFLAVYLQTIAAPVVTTLLFFAVFALAFGGVAREVGDVPFLQFLAPGLIMMAMVQNAFSNTSSSLIIAKVQGNIVDVLMPPLSSFELLAGFTIGGVVRGLCVGIVGIIVVSLFVHLPVVSIPFILAFALLGTTMMSIMGVIGGIVSQKFDHIAAFTNFFVTPLTFLSGTFYSIGSLPEMWHALALYNPFFYMIDGFRSGFIGQADGNQLIGLGVLVVVDVVLYFIAYRMLKTGYRIKS